MRVRSLGWEDPLEMGMATHSSILAWRIPPTEESCCSEKGKKGVGDEFFFFSFPENKEDAGNNERAWSFLVFTLTVPTL